MSTSTERDLEKGDVRTTDTKSLKEGRIKELNNGGLTIGFEDSATAPGPQTYMGPHDYPRRRIGNPGPLGLFSFASTTFILSIINIQTRGITTANVVVGMAIFCGGLTQLLAGMWEFASGNTFGATAFSSYGAFWMSYATILIPGSGITSAYTSTTELDNAIGIYLISWFMFTLLMLIAALRKNVGFIALFSCLTVTFLCLAIAKFNGSVATAKAGGVLGTVTAFIAYYIGLADMLSRREAYFMLPLGEVPKRLD